MTMDKSKSLAAMEVERYSKQATLRLQQGFPEKALEAYKNAFKNAQSLTNHGYMLRACAFNVGAMLVSTGNYPEGLAYLNKAIPPEGKRDGRSNGDLFFNYGLAYEGLKNITKAKSYYENALKEYKSEHDSVKMEAETMSRISRFCLENNLISDANDWMKELATLYAKNGDVEKELQSRIERSNLLLKMGRAQEAEDVADECSKVLENTTPSLNFAKMYSDLSVAYTQILRYDKAVQCSEKALPLVENSTSDPRLASVIYQNLGAIYNYMGRFEDAVKYHEKACNNFAKLQMRANQGHCFTNMGYAYSQLKDMDKAGECFLHGLQAARDCGDNKTEWQNLEALASVAYHKKQLKKAEQHYQQAIAVLSQSNEVGDPSVHERLMNKLKNVIQAQAQAQTSKPSTLKGNTATYARRLSSNKENYKSRDNAIQKLLQNEKNVEKTNTVQKDLQTLASEIESGNIKVIRKGSQVRYLKVRRSGTLRRFKKVALGLDIPSEDEENAADLEEDEEGDDEENVTDKSSSSSDKTNEDAKDSKDKKNEKEEETKRLRTQSARPPDSYLPRDDANRHSFLSEGSSENNGSVEQLDADEESDDESDDEARVKRLMKQQLTEDNENRLGRSGKHVVEAEVHDQVQIDDESSESDSSGSSTEEDKRLKPPVPAQSPGTTAEKNVRTYETPVLRKGMSFRPRDQKPAAGSRKEEDDDMKGDTVIYESIRSQPTTSQKMSEEERDSDGNELSEGEMGKLSRAEKDVVMYKEFKSANKEKEDAGSETGDQKNSKHCIVM